VYGVTVETWATFPELQSARQDAPVDAVFRLGDVPAEIPGCLKRGARFQTAPGRLLVWLDNVARYLVSEGREIVVQPAEGATESDLRLFLLCSPMGGLLLQRGCLPLHASAVATGRGAVVFMGPSGAGKSTLAARFQRRGLRPMADDISVIRFAPDGKPWVMPGLPQFKLWPDAVASLGSTADELARLRPQVEKRAYPLGEGFHAEPMPLQRIYVLRAGGKRELHRLEGMDKLAQILRHTYRAQFVPGLGLAAPHFEAASRLADAARMTLFSRGADEGPDSVADRIAADIGT
jgi:hypothetical protein